MSTHHLRSASEDTSLMCVMQQVSRAFFSSSPYTTSCAAGREDRQGGALAHLAGLGRCCVAEGTRQVASSGGLLVGSGLLERLNGLLDQLITVCRVRGRNDTLHVCGQWNRP